MMAKAMEGKLVGYEGNSGKIYRIVLKHTNRFVRARDARFIEDVDNRFTEEDDNPEDPIYEVSFNDTYKQGGTLTLVKHNESNEVQKKDSMTEQSEPASDEEEDEDDDAIFHDAGEASLPTPEMTPQQSRNLSPSWPNEDDEEEINREKTVDNDAGRRSSRRQMPPGYYNTLHSKGKEAADKQFTGFFVDFDQFVKEDADFTPFALNNAFLLAAATGDNTNNPSLPKTYNEALKRPDFTTHWKPALVEQLGKLTNAGTLGLVEQTPGMKILPGKWVLDHKFNHDGSWARNRARWVACGNFENEDHAPYEVYSAVVHVASVRIFTALVATLGLNSHQFDIVAAYLYALVPDGVEVYVR